MRNYYHKLFILWGINMHYRALYELIDFYLFHMMYIVTSDWSFLQ